MCINEIKIEEKPLFLTMLDKAIPKLYIILYQTFSQ